MNTMLTVEEINLICVFAGESRTGVIGELERVLPYLDGLDMEELSRNVIRKLQEMTDEEFDRLELVEAD